MPNLGIRMTPVGLANLPLFNTRGFTNGASKVVSDAVKDGQRFMAEYPEKSLTAGGYKRTGTLKRSWSSQVITGFNRLIGIVGSSSNIAPYNRDVQGVDQEYIFKKAGWKNVDDLKDYMEELLDGKLDIAIKKSVE